MKSIEKIKFLLVISSFLWMAFPSYAVTLPTTSYQSYGGDYSATSSGVASPSMVSLPSSSYHSLGDTDSQWCQTQVPGTSGCTECCYSENAQCEENCGDDYSCKVRCWESNKSCIDYCDGHSLPLGSGLCMIFMALVSAVVRVSFCRKEHK